MGISGQFNSDCSCVQLYLRDVTFHEEQDSLRVRDHALRNIFWITQYTLKINRLKTKQEAKHLSSHLGKSHIVLIVKQSACFMWNSWCMKQCRDCYKELGFDRTPVATNEKGKTEKLLFRYCFTPLNVSVETKIWPKYAQVVSRETVCVWLETPNF